MTGAAAVVDPRPGGRFSAWDGYITGRTLEVEPGRRIVQSWRTSEFDDETEDSRIEVVLVPAGQGTEITIRHSNVPSDQRGYEEGGWQESYFEPMRTYFAAPGRRHLSSKGGPTRTVAVPSRVTPVTAFAPGVRRLDRSGGLRSPTPGRMGYSTVGSP